MTIIIDVSRMHSNNKHRGVGLYTQSLFEYLEKVDCKHSYILKTDTDQTMAADVIHYPYFDFFFSTLPYKKVAPTIVTIHDAIPLLFPDHYKPGTKGKFNYIKQRLSLKRVDHIITNSQTSKADICDKLSISKDRVTPIAMAANPRLSSKKLTFTPEVITSLKLNKPFFLYVGDINFNKNLPFLLTAFAATSFNASLVLVSKAMADDIPESRQIRQRIRDLHLSNRVIVAENIPAEPIDSLQWLYQNAIAYIQPSLYEGFGIPVLEALSCGTLVISSTGGSLKEFVSDAIFPVDPLDSQSLTSALNQLVELPQSQKEILKKTGLDFASSFSWETHAKKTVSLYEQVAKL